LFVPVFLLTVGGLPSTVSPRTDSWDPGCSFHRPRIPPYCLRC
jgi:hypothetical protein